MAKAKDAKATEPSDIVEAPARGADEATPAPAASAGMEASLLALIAAMTAREEIPEFAVRTELSGEGDVKFPKKLVRITFDDIGYPGWTCDGWLNAPVNLVNRWDAAPAQGEEEFRRLALIFFPDWNFVTPEGSALPRTVAGFDDVPQEVFNRMIRGRLATIARSVQNPLGGTSSAPPNREQKRAAARRNGATGRR